MPGFEWGVLAGFAWSVLAAGALALVSGARRADRASEPHNRYAAPETAAGVRSQALDALREAGFSWRQCGKVLEHYPNWPNSD